MEEPQYIVYYYGKHILLNTISLINKQLNICVTTHLPIDNAIHTLYDPTITYALEHKFSLGMQTSIINFSQDPTILQASDVGSRAHQIHVINFDTNELDELNQTINTSINSISKYVIVNRDMVIITSIHGSDFKIIIDKVELTQTIYNVKKPVVMVSRNTRGKKKLLLSSIIKNVGDSVLVTVNYISTDIYLIRINDKDFTLINPNPNKNDNE